MRVMVACALAAILLLAVEDHTSAASQTLCGQTIQFEITPPAADVPADVRAFSGVWLGNWYKTGRCLAMIFEDVGRDGAVALITVFGNMPGYAANLPVGSGSAGSVKHRGQVRSGVLEFRGNDGTSVTYRISKPNEIAGKASWITSGGEEGLFKRQSF